MDEPTKAPSWDTAVRATEAAEAVRRMCQEQAAQRSVELARDEALNVLAAWCNEKGIGYDAYRNRSAIYATWSRIPVAPEVQRSADGIP